MSKIEDRSDWKSCRQIMADRPCERRLRLMQNPKKKKKKKKKKGKKK